MEIVAPPPPAEVTDSALDAVARAASAAQDAADQAAAAAAAIAVKGAAATKAATAAAASAGASAAFQLPLRPLVGGVFVPSKLPFQVDPSKVDATKTFDASARARENLAIIKANFLEGFRGITDATSSVVVDVPKVGGNAPSSTAAAEAASTFAAVIASLHLREYGGWYAAVAMGVIALNQRSRGREDATAAYEGEIASARERASEAAAAAGLAAEGAKTAKMLAMKMERDLTMDGGKALLESSRSKMAEVEKASVCYCYFLFLR